MKMIFMWGSVKFMPLRSRCRIESEKWMNFEIVSGSELSFGAELEEL